MPMLYTFGLELNYHLTLILSCTKSLAINILYPTWINLVVQSYCLLCHGASKLISDLIVEIKDCSPQEFTISKQKDILKMESTVHKAVLEVQSIFSLTSFLICIVHFCVCITILTAFINVTNSEHSFFVQSVNILYFVNSFGGLLACLWVAGACPNKAKNFKEAFGRKIRERKLHERWVSEVCFAESLNELSDYTLTGCEIIYFQRSSILALSGTLLTYTFLLISWR
ncbi:hypothetical protein AVEN_58604-1 [Araneus ventricosus]|uniref:Gustatory receptor n=1 Tax=Araneus ventricosus TaxID=182803 RepID=A0A4Y2FI57_ARAVE|nr:hypothetical protein AVEN_58604-1 [Araneus ventricosus]